MGSYEGLISIIVPVYNVADYIDRCIESIISQTYKNIEIIIVDDGSTDGSGEICDKWGKKDSRIQVYHQKNEGAASARNFGLTKMKGEFIGFIDSDDYIADDMYESLMKYMDKDVDITVCGRLHVYPRSLKRNNYISGKAPHVLKMTNDEAVRELLKTQYLDFSACLKLYRKEIFDGVKFPTGKTCEDIPLTYHVIKRSRNVVNIGKVKYYNLFREDSTSNSKFRRTQVTYILFARDILRDIKTNYPKLIKLAEARYINNIVDMIYFIKKCDCCDENRQVLFRLRKVLIHMQMRIWLNKDISLQRKNDIISLIREFK
jgi:glycosyltransferase involved in cell wall biosynthesis